MQPTSKVHGIKIDLVWGYYIRSLLQLQTWPKLPSSLLSGCTSSLTSAQGPVLLVEKKGMLVQPIQMPCTYPWLEFFFNIGYFRNMAFGILQQTTAAGRKEVQCFRSGVTCSARCLIWFTTFPTPQYVPQGSSCWLTSGMAFASKLASGLKPAFLAKLPTHQSSTGNVPGPSLTLWPHPRGSGRPPPTFQWVHIPLTVVDHFTCWQEAILLPDMTTLTCAQALVIHWITCFGVLMDMSQTS